MVDLWCERVVWRTPRSRLSQGGCRGKRGRGGQREEGRQTVNSGKRIRKRAGERMRGDE